MCLKKFPGLFLLQLDMPGSTVLLKLPFFRDKVVCYAHDLYFRDKFFCRSFVFDALVDPRIEALYRVGGVEGFLHLGAILHEFRGQDPGVVTIKIDDQEERRHSVVARKRVLGEGEVVIL